MLVLANHPWKGPHPGLLAPNDPVGVVTVVLGGVSDGMAAYTVCWDDGLYCEKKQNLPVYIIQ